MSSLSPCPTRGPHDRRRHHRTLTAARALPFAALVAAVLAAAAITSVRVRPYGGGGVRRNFVEARWWKKKAHGFEDAERAERWGYIDPTSP